MEFYDYVKAKLDALGVVYSPENDRKIERIKEILHRVFADYNQVESMKLQNTIKIATEYKPEIDVLLASLSLPEIVLDETNIKDIVDNTEVVKEIVVGAGEEIIL